MNTNVIEPIAAEGIGTAKQEGDITMEKVYTFRKLNSTDTFLMFKIIGKIGVNDFAKSFDKDTIQNLMDTKGENANTIVGISVMLEMANVVISNLPKCEAEVYQMLANTSNLTVEQVKGLDFATFAEMVIDFIKKEEFKDFIKVVSRLFKSEN